MRSLGPSHAALRCLAVAAGTGVTALAADQRIETRMVIATEVVCRAAPSLSAPVVRGYALGDLIGASKSVESQGVTWHFDQTRVSGVSPSCWIHGRLTVPYDRTNPETALLAAADHVLGRGTAVPFEDYVAVENLLLQTTTTAHGDETGLATSGLLQFRRLQIVQRAASDSGLSRRAVARAPLTNAWLFAHRDLVRYFEPGDTWAMLPEKYWELFEGNRNEPWAEDAAWTAARTPIFTDECYETCVLDAIDRTYARYVGSFPRGRSVDEALAKMTERARYAAHLNCLDGPSERLRQLVARIRRSVGDVTAPSKNEVLAQLGAIEHACGAGEPRV